MSDNTKALMDEIARLREENSQLKAPKPLTFKVSEKGAVSVYGNGRFPVTLYKQQWERLIDNIDNLKAFIAENSERLSVKQ